MFEIVKNIPIPSVRTAGGRAIKYPFRNMVDVGDSFQAVVSIDEAKQIQRAAAAFARRNGVKFTTRRSDTGVGVWRIA